MMVTVRQRRAAKLIIENATLDKPLNAGQIVEKSRYSKSMVIKPSLVLESAGVKDALNEAGFSEDNAKKVVAEILLSPLAKDNDRLKAADMVFDVHGSKAPLKNINVNIETEANDEIKALTEKLNAIHRGTGESGNGRIAGSLGPEAQD